MYLFYALSVLSYFQQLIKKINNNNNNFKIIAFHFSASFSLVRSAHLCCFFLEPLSCLTVVKAHHFFIYDRLFINKYTWLVLSALLGVLYIIATPHLQNANYKITLFTNRLNGFWEHQKTFQKVSPMCATSIRLQQLPFTNFERKTSQPLIET